MMRSFLLLSLLFCSHALKLVPNFDPGQTGLSFNKLDAKTSGKLAVKSGTLSRAIVPQAVESDLPKVSILTYSNGQSYTYNNVMYNVFYQTYPHDKLELIFMESSAEPSKEWQDRADGKQLQEWSNMVEEGNPFHGQVSVVYKWFPRDQDPGIGNLRNMAKELATGEYLVNMDNDDIYHPSYVHYVVHHMQNRNLDYLVISPHAMLRLMPDGSSELDGKGYSVGVGGHCMSMTKRAAQKCSFSGNRAGEEHQMRKCVVDNFNGQTANMGMTNGTYGNTFLLTKVDNPLSITMQKWFVDRELFNRLQAKDFEDLYKHQAYIYESIHEQTRPEAYPALSELFKTSWEAPKTWKAFHNRHPNFLDDQNFPHCEGFAKLPGQLFKMDMESSQISEATTAAECCKRCSGLFNADLEKQMGQISWHNQEHAKDNITAGFCAGYEFEISTKKCTLGFTGVQYQPESALTHEVGVRVSSCPKCGKGFRGGA